MWPPSAVVAAIVAGRSARRRRRGFGRPGAADDRPPTPAQLVGQSIMTGMDGRVPSRALLARIRAGQVGGVILFARQHRHARASSRSSSPRFRRAAAAGGNPPLADRGRPGRRRRETAARRAARPVAGGDGPRRERARGRSREGRRPAAYLKQLGIDVDLAPVLDTPTSPSSFLGSRAFSRDPRLNAELGTAFVEGSATWRRRGDRQALPGPRHRAAIDRHEPSRARHADEACLERQLAPFARAIDAGVKLVMVSNAGYARLRPHRRPGRALAADRHRPPPRIGSASRAS